MCHYKNVTHVQEPLRLSTFIQTNGLSWDSISLTTIIDTLSTQENALTYLILTVVLFFLMMTKFWFWINQNNFLLWVSASNILTFLVFTPNQCWWLIPKVLFLWTYATDLSSLIHNSVNQPFPHSGLWHYKWIKWYQWSSSWGTSHVTCAEYYWT